MHWLLMGVLLFQLSSVVMGQNCTKNNDTIYEDANCRTLWQGVVQPITIDATDMKPIHHACQDHRCTINIHNFIANCIHDSVTKYMCVYVPLCTWLFFYWLHISTFKFEHIGTHSWHSRQRSSVLTLYWAHTRSVYTECNLFLTLLIYF